MYVVALLRTWQKKSIFLLKIVCGKKNWGYPKSPVRNDGDKTKPKARFTSKKKKMFDS